MRILLTGHAGLFVEANGKTVLCDPWFNTAYFGSWFPFPDNSELDLDRIRAPDYLYVSHLHKDHFDAQFLADHVDKSAAVLLPDFPIAELREELEGLGFHRFVQTRSGRVTEVEGLRVAIVTSTSVADGPIGDSALVVDDGKTTILNQNDCHPRDLSPLRALGPYDAHFLQYSGAIWYPMVYRWDADVKAKLSMEKRERQGQRAQLYIRSIRAAHVVPFAGPPAFLDEPLFELNDLDDDPTNIFQDQRSFIRLLEAQGIENAHLAVAGSEIDLSPGSFSISWGEGTRDVEAIFDTKTAYLRAYRERRREEIAAAMPAPMTSPASDRGRGRGEDAFGPIGAEQIDADDVVATLKEWIEPLLAHAPSVRNALGSPILIDVGRFGVVIDPRSSSVRKATEADAAEAGHAFFFDEALLRSLVDRRVEDWVNELFLSCRFQATRRGEYNEVVFSFFKCLVARRMEYLEASLSLAARAIDRGTVDPGELWRCGDYLVQRRCPHLGADLSRFGHVDGGVLTCSLHGNRYDLATGRCLSAEGLDLFTVPAETVQEIPYG